MSAAECSTASARSVRGPSRDELFGLPHPGGTAGEGVETGAETRRQLLQESAFGVQGLAHPVGPTLALGDARQAHAARDVQQYEEGGLAVVGDRVDADRLQQGGQDQRQAGDAQAGEEHAEGQSPALDATILEADDG